MYDYTPPPPPPIGQAAQQRSKGKYITTPQVGKVHNGGLKVNVWLHPPPE